MKVQCEQCDELVPLGQFELGEGGIQVTCPSCAACYFVVSGDNTPSQPAGQRPDDSDDHIECPKCGAPVAMTRPACDRCGLASDKFAAFELEADSAVPDELRALWEECAERWNDAGVHDRFCQAAVNAGAFAFAARCYRTSIGAREGDGIAERRLHKVARMAEAALLSAASARRAEADSDNEPYKAVLILLIVLVLIAGIGGVYLLLRADRDPDGSNRFQRAPADVEARLLRASTIG